MKSAKKSKKTSKSPRKPKSEKKPKSAVKNVNVKARKSPARKSFKAKVAQSLDTVVAQVEALFSKDPKDTVDAIKRDHDSLRNFVDILKDGHRDMAERRRAYELFSELLKSHSVAEERAVYASVEKIPVKDLKIEIAEGIVEHEVANDLMAKMEFLDDPRIWGAHANVLAEIVDHHLKEEEEELLPLIRKNAPRELDEAMLAAYIDLRAVSQKKVQDENAGILTTLQ